MHFRAHGKRGKVRNVPVHPKAQRLIHEYLEADGHGDNPKAPLFRPVKNNATKTLDKSLHAESAYTILKHYAAQVGIDTLSA